MIPLRDTNPGLSLPLMTFVLIGISVFIFLFVQGATIDANGQIYRLAAIPCEVATGDPLDFEEITGGTCVEEPLGDAFAPDKPVYLSLVASVFLHGSLLHLLGNMWSLWIFGNNVEDAFGRRGYLAFYLAAGVAAGLAHVALNPDSVIPVVGASGAIAGVMGAYLVLFPRAHVRTLIVYLPVGVPAWVFLVICFLSQFWISASSPEVAWQAHVGGFLFGVAVTLTLRGALMRRLRSHHFPFEVVAQPHR